MSWTPTTEDVLDAMKKGWPIADDAMNRWLAKVKREVWDEAVNTLIPTIRCDGEDITWVNKNPYWKVTDATDTD